MRFGFAVAGMAAAAGAGLRGDLPARTLARLARAAMALSRCFMIA